MRKPLPKETRLKGDFSPRQGDELRKRSEMPFSRGGERAALWSGAPRLTVTSTLLALPHPSSLGFLAQSSSRTCVSVPFSWGLVFCCSRSEGHGSQRCSCNIFSGVFFPSKPECFPLTRPCRWIKLPSWLHPNCRPGGCQRHREAQRPEPNQYSPLKCP